jgi:hypothetical protein
LEVAANGCKAVNVPENICSRSVKLFSIYLPQYIVINKEFAGNTIVVANFITCDLSGEIQETPFNVGEEVERRDINCI